MVTFDVWMKALSSLTTHDRKHAASIQRMLLSDDYWSNLARFTSLFEPLVKVLQMVDSDDKSQMRYIYEAMDRAKEAIKNNLSKDYKRYNSIINRRWTKTLHHDLHAAGYYLNPRFMYARSATIDNEVMGGFRNVLNRMFT